MNNTKLAITVMLISLTIFLFACSGYKVQPTVTVVSPTIAVVSPTTAIVSPTVTLTAVPSPTSLPSLTPTVEPFARQTKIETVTDNAVTGDGGNAWGGHQTRIVHTQDGIFTAYTVDGKDDLNREWRLAERQSDGTWPVIAKGKSGREPVNLMASPDGTLNIVGWPNGLATLWSGKPENSTVIMKETRIPNELNGNWPYNSAGIDANGDLCVVSSEGGEQPGGLFYVACYLPAKGKWVTQTNTLDYRFCYTYVFPGNEGQLSLVSTRDVRWQALGYKQPVGEFDYVYNAFGFWRTEDVLKDPLKRVYLLEDKPTEQGANVYLNAQEDAYIDTKGLMHILYKVQDESTNNQFINHQAIISPDGKVIDDEQLLLWDVDYARIFQDQEGQFYLLSSSGLLYPMGMEGTDPGIPIMLNLGGNQVEYSGFGVSVPRTGTPLSNVLDVVFPSDSGTEWLYFQLDFSHQ